MRAPNLSYKKQKGIALVMAVMITALVVTIAVEMSWRFDLSIARTSNRWASSEADNYLDGMTALAKLVLRWDFEEDVKDEKKVERLDEGWLYTPLDRSNEYATVMGRLEDAQGRFNINLLAETTGKPTELNPVNRYTEHQKRFIRLLQTINISEEDDQDEYPVYLEQYQAMEIVDAIIDWMDYDTEYSPNWGNGGVEADYYANLEPPVTIANKPMVSVTELRVIKGMTPILYEGLLPFVIALQPASEGGNMADIGININTASMQVIRSLNSPDILEPLNIEIGEKLFNDTQGGFDSIEEFLDSSQVSFLWRTGRKDEQGNEIINLDHVGLEVSSEYFVVQAMTEIGEEIYRGQTLLYRNSESGEVKVLRRTTANF